jgi:hypothetical protein
VHPAYQGRGVGGKLIEARYDIIRDLNLRGMVAGSLIIDYYKVADEVSADQYVRDVIAGVRFDNNLTKQLKKGFQVHSLIPNYSNTYESMNWGVEIVWNNPDYTPARRPGRVVMPHRYTIPARPARPAAGGMSTGLQPLVAR